MNITTKKTIAIIGLMALGVLACPFMGFIGIFVFIFIVYSCFRISLLTDQEM